ncbi:preprotein translocase subunit SecF, partial [mine drainage metagenome]
MSENDVVETATEARHYGRLGRLYRGLTTVDFVGRKRTWFTISLVIIVLGMGSLALRGFNLGIDFRGGSSWEVLAPHSSITAVTNAVDAAGLTQPTVEKLGSETYQVTADLNALSSAQQGAVTTRVVNAMAKVAGTSPNQVSTSSVGPTWGGQITQRALEALIVFFIAVIAYISLRFEPKMALAAFVAMIHDLLV